MGNYNHYIVGQLDDHRCFSANVNNREAFSTGIIN